MSINVAVIGPGGVGKAFLSQLAQYNKRSDNTYKLVLLARSKVAAYTDDLQEIAFDSWQSTLDKAIKPADLTAMLATLKTSKVPVILVDNTSNEAIAARYGEILDLGIHIATPNKKGFSSDLQAFKDTQRKAKGRGLCFHESSVGAGLPILSTLKDLVETGDTICKIEGIFSGTLSYLFNTFSPASAIDALKQGDDVGLPKFSQVVQVAKDSGFTEPDPRDDLNGLDVARKLTILSRLSGLDIASPTSFPVQSLIPEALESCESGDAFLKGLPDHDDAYGKQRAEAAQNDSVLRFVGSIEMATQQVSVALKAFPKTSAFAGLKGSDNVVAFYTERYGGLEGNPLIVQGAGAGGDVTAMGVLADVLKIGAIVQGRPGPGQ
ncbi:homoserine dehydrogenase [Protomyces lactucae-debilis]|uniref:Homoserine dehydrogenase n=1 Tax=Protomyces lactucae-debilis TaxID=2754530 RepID=A0A1Y2FXK8_PROLT|nr:homoserine dehydrogenase [Protomyces lactucae-debilis]ORY87916.1 homoserine dehydrogenase [Protomyces lactucae-debilis]